MRLRLSINNVTLIKWIGNCDENIFLTNNCHTILRIYQIFFHTLSFENISRNKLLYFKLRDRGERGMKKRDVIYGRPL